MAFCLAAARTSLTMEAMAVVEAPCSFGGVHGLCKTRVKKKKEKVEGKAGCQFGRWTRTHDVSMGMQGPLTIANSPSARFRIPSV